MPAWFLAMVGTVVGGVIAFLVQQWWLNRRSRTTRCRTCKGLKTEYVRVIIPRSELSAAEQAELMVNGGYAYRLEAHPCSRCTPEETA